MGMEVAHLSQVVQEAFSVAIVKTGKHEILEYSEPSEGSADCRRRACVKRLTSQQAKTSC